MDKIQEFEKTQIKRQFPDIRPGDTVRVHQKITEESSAKGKKGDKERIQIFEGLVLRVRGGLGINGSFLVRKTASGVGVEKNFPIHMPSLVKVEVVKRGRVRRARLYYLRDKKEKDSRLKEIKLSTKELENLKFDETVEEEPKEEKKVEDKPKTEGKDNKKKEPQKTQKKTENTEKKKDDKAKLEDKPKDKPENKVEAKDNKESKSKENSKDKSKDSKK